MRWPHEPVRGRYIPITYCIDCGRAIIDAGLMDDYPQQTWGSFDIRQVRLLGIYYRGYLNFVPRCYADIRKHEKRDIEKENDARKLKWQRNCCVCGDPFQLYSFRAYTRYLGLVCNKKKCRDRAKAFAGLPYQKADPRELRDFAKAAVYSGKFRIANIAFLICELLYYARKSNDRRKPKKGSA